MSTLFTASGLQFAYNPEGMSVPILSGAEFSVQKKSFCCLVGPSGTGKTTLLNILGLIETVQSGNLTFLDQPVQSLDEKQKEKLRLHDIGFVFQSFYLLPTLTVRENSSYFLPLLGLTKSEAKSCVDHYLESLGLIDLAERYPSEISGGQRQRVAIARALVKKPKVILADEPTANLDSKTAESIIQVFKKLQNEDGVSFFFSTHDQRLMKYADQMLTIDAGKISPVGNAQ